MTRSEITNGRLSDIIKYLIFYGMLLVLPPAIVAICIVVVDRLHGGTMDSDSVWQTPFMTASMLLGTVLAIVVFLWRRWAVLGLGRIRRADVLKVCLMAIVLFIGWFLPEELLQRLVEVPDNLSDKEFEQLTSGLAGLIDTAVVAPISEELLCRGAIFGTLLKMMPRRPWVAIVISALIFGVIHLNPVQMVFGALYGLLLGWLAWRTGSLLPSIVVHVANNTTVMLMPASAEKVIVNMSLTTEVLLAGVSLIVLFAALRWFNLRYKYI